MTQPEKPQPLIPGYTFAWGQTVKHVNGKLYWVCDLSSAENGIYGLIERGYSCAIPRYQESELNLTKES